CRFCSEPVADPPSWKIRTRHLVLDRPLIMGIVNVTPDSFSDGGRYQDPELAIQHGLDLAQQGADLVDVGGESTRPGSEGVPAEIELARVLPVVEALATRGVAVSIDTSKATVARHAIEAGAEVINDVTAGSDPDMLGLAAESGCGLVLMHMQGTPRTMQERPSYEDVVREVKDFLVERALAAEFAGIDRAAISIDPGIGFGKTVDHNLELLRRLGELVSTGYPVAVGTSRKGFLGHLTGVDQPEERDVATAATTALAVMAGAAMVRVHDVESSRQAARIAWAIARTRI